MSRNYPIESEMPIFKSTKKFRGIHSPIVGRKVSNKVAYDSIISPTGKYTKEGYALNKNGVPLNKRGINALKSNINKDKITK